ncbi:hypothetical protein [Glaesserella sp.]|uniref:hypothetical protein n=1 Tax=Glaesserella sp. TaxID=2094731 RepID=UPI0035A0ECBE
MKFTVGKIVLITTMCISLTACVGDRSDRRVATGAAIGAATGYVLSDGDTAITLGSAALGGLLGNQYDKHRERSSNRDYDDDRGDREYRDKYARHHKGKHKPRYRHDDD